MKRHLFILPFLLLIGIVPLSAQEKYWSLEQCIDYALENNISVKMQDLNVQMDKVNLQQSRATMLPNLNANATHGYNWGQTVDLYTNEFATDRVQTNNFYVQTQVTLFNGFRLLNTVRQNSLLLQSSKYEADKLRNDVILNIVTAFMQVLFANEQLEITQGQMDITKQQVERTKEMVDAGALPKGDLLSMEAQLATEELNLISVENAVESAYLTLIQLMDLPVDSSFSILAPQIDVVDDNGSLLVPLHKIYGIALGNQPQIKSAELQLESAETGIRVAKGASMPSLYLSGSVGTGYSGARKDFIDPVIGGWVPTAITGSGDTVYSPQWQYTEVVKPFNEQIDENLNVSLSIYLSIPIFNGLQNHSNVQRAEINKANAEYNLELQKQLVVKDIQQAYTDAKAAFKKYEASEKSVQALKEAYSYAAEKYNVGMINSVELNDAKNKLNQAESDLLSAKYEYIFKVKILDFYLGKPIKL